MAKLAIMSDLHVDSNKLTESDLKMLIEVLKGQNVTRLHLAGDTANTVSRLINTVDFMEHSGLPVTFNFGNHEMPSLKDEALIEEFQDRRFLNITTNDLTDKIVLLGVNGWYDYSFSLEEDWTKITAAKNLYWYDRLIDRQKSDPEITRDILTKLEKKLIELNNQQKKVILATHFVPRKEFIHYFTGKWEKWNQINAFLGTDELGKLIDSFDHVSHVVFGHTHRKYPEQTINGAIYTAKPFGYFYEWGITKEFMLNKQLMTSFNPMKVRRLLKNHQKEFAYYKERHLKEEFLKSITLIDY